MKKFFIIAGMLTAGAISAQQAGSVGINSPSVNGATLDVSIATSGVNAKLGQGIAFPRVEKSVLDAMDGDITTSAMVYVTDFSAASSNTRTADVKSVGYYFFDGTKWTKLGGGATTSSSTPWENIRSTAKQEVKSSTADVKNDVWIVYVDYKGDVTLKLPKLNDTTDAGKMISFIKIGNGNISFIDHNDKSSSDNASLIKGSTGITTNRSKIIMWDGSKWYPVTY